MADTFVQTDYAADDIGAPICLTTDLAQGVIYILQGDDVITIFPQNVTKFIQALCTQRRELTEEETI